MGKPLLGYLVSHPIQYQAPLFRRLAESRSVDFIAFFGSDFGVRASFDPQFGREVNYGIDLLGGYRSVFLDQAGSRVSVDRFWGLRTRSIHSVSHAAPVDVLTLHGWRTAMMWQAAAGARLRRVPYLMRAETPEFRHARRSFSPLQLVRDRAVGGLIRGAAGALALGAANERFYERMGVPRSRVHRVPYFVDNESVARAAARGRSERERILSALGVPARSIVLVAVGKLMPRKRPLDLVHVLPTLPKCVHVLWIGSGEMEATVRREAESLGVADRLSLAGFRPAEETWEILGASDLFALPSEREPWGLVANEAVAAGLPILVSDECGSAEDLVAPDRTGSIVSTGDLPAWSGAIASWARRIASGDRGDASRRQSLADAHSIMRAAAMIEEVVLQVART